MRSLAAAVVLLLTGTAAAEPAGPGPGDDPPWAAGALAKDQVPRVYLGEHEKAENRETCPLLVITDMGKGKGAKPRRANFSGGWAVAYDRKGQRSAFGVAGAGVEKGGGYEWPKRIEWKDGSRAGYGPEGGVGPKLLAYVEASDATCLYNVWSALGEEHLLTLIRGLRRVR